MVFGNSPQIPQPSIYQIYQPYPQSIDTLPRSVSPSSTPRPCVTSTSRPSGSFLTACHGSFSPRSDTKHAEYKYDSNAWQPGTCLWQADTTRVRRSWIARARGPVRCPSACNSPLSSFQVVHSRVTHSRGMNVHRGALRRLEEGWLVCPRYTAAPVSIGFSYVPVLSPCM